MKGLTQNDKILLLKILYEEAENISDKLNEVPSFNIGAKIYNPLSEFEEKYLEDKLKNIEKLINKIIKL